MKTLNRPMFRYGGPIKEGIMDGIRENKRQGGSMGNNEGPRRAALVGNPIYPNVAGRTNHVIPAVIGAGLAMPVIGAGIRAAARPFGKFVMRQIPKLTKTGKNMYKKGAKKTKKNQIFEEQQGFDANPVGKYLAGSPEAGLVTGTGGMVGKAVYGSGKYVLKSPLLAGGLIWTGAQWITKDGKPVVDPPPPPRTNDRKGTSGAPGGGDPDMTYTAPEKELTADEKKALENKARMEKMDSYREIMDIKGMNRDAAYKSLIDASKIIGEGGNLKEGIRDGSLISKLTGAASKRFDKVSDTDAALRSLVAKGEIEKDLNKDKDKLGNALKNAQLVALNKANSGTDFKEAMAQKIIKGDPPTGSALQSLLRVTEGMDSKVIQSNNMEQGQDEIAYVTEVIKTSNANPETPPFPAGNYVIKGRVLIIDEQGNITPFL